ncbi:hypothetical protein PInf_011632 [Phytophthora infestans]|nr:hypothetical protein PInf_011632 [Phytophthora infestans]
MRVVCVSDTHGLHEDAVAIPDGDVFVHAGDFTDTGERSEVVAFNEFLGRLPHRYKLVIAGNHESSFDRAFYPEYWHQYGHRQKYDPEEVRALLTNALYLEDQAVLIEGFVFYGSPWQPEFCNWAFNLPRGGALLKKWRYIPTDTDVLITHTPPMGHGDLVGYQRVGCADLLREVSSRVRPKLHVFGHVHEGYGRSASPDGAITYFNASICTHNYEPVNAPFFIHYGRRGCRHGRRFPTEAEPRDYDLMLHEWLRLCSHKPPFIEKKLVEVETCEVHTKGKLREFRVDGTTSGLLFESTLKLRPVTNVQKRALRYLFSQGYRSNSENYKAEAGGEGEEEKSLDDATSMDVDSEDNKPTRERRNYGISRRVTVAVLDDINEIKEGMDDRDREHVQHARVAAAALGKETALDTAGEGATSRRPRRNKTLQRRSAVPKLASLTEEPEENSTNAMDASAPPPVSEEVVVSETVVVVECVLCKYKVSGHVHPNAEPPLPPPPTPVIECALCKYKVPGHVHPGAQPAPPAPVVEVPKEEKREEKKPNPRTDNPPPKRLSSWF